MEIKVRAHNKRAYVDILKDIIKQKNGNFSFQLTIHEGNITDYTRTNQTVLKLRREKGVRVL